MTYSITELANEFEITPRALRFYEEKGLLIPARDGQTRIYSHKDRARLQLILSGRSVGLTLREIGDIFDLYQADGDCEEQYKLAISLFRRRMKVVQEQREMVDQQIERLHDICSNLEQKLEATHEAPARRAANNEVHAPAMS
ncbi:MerR family DNA-binding transcriptional regulator [Parvibaculum sp.]|jgi:DNA-binding transcriptional MerR regulator|uniref:MerR family transcriptional regulator n=1 Tax=Parvibaculum sp. TaxID=2024848 RepID=UPI000C90305B|nr:MerR family DNA-binding transcriptional regulator [Parvibaculum sp.]MAB12974.1 transcriptional regulator [Parvibaculum sp.]